MERVQAVDPDVLMTLDILLAATDYEEFVGYMLEFKHANSWQEDEQDPASNEWTTPNRATTEYEKWSVIDRIIETVKQNK